jgi:hypothetical protein
MSTINSSRCEVCQAPASIRLTHLSGAAVTTSNYCRVHGLPLWNKELLPLMEREVRQLPASSDRDRAESLIAELRRSGFHV